jgi:hypothetical protein
MRQSGERDSLLLEALGRIAISRHGRGDHLDSHATADPLVMRAVDCPHPARAEQLLDLVGIDERAGYQVHEARIEPRARRRIGIRSTFGSWRWERFDRTSGLGGDFSRLTLVGDGAHRGERCRCCGAAALSDVKRGLALTFIGLRVVNERNGW